MKDYISLLIWIICLYFLSWHDTGGRKESVLVKVNKSIAKLFFYIDSSDGISIVSMITGLFAHVSLICFIILIFWGSTVKPYMGFITITWLWMGLLLLSVGLTIEACIKLKRAELRKKRRELQGLIIILICTVVFMLYYTVKYSQMLCKLL